MGPKQKIKPKRHKKRKSRTDVTSDDESGREVSPQSQQEEEIVSVSSKPLTDAEVSAAFTKFYMQRATMEFEEDLDSIRGADDFKDDALPSLINALQQGMTIFSIEEQRRIVTAGLEKDQKAGSEGRG